MVQIGRFSFRQGSIHARQQQRLREIADFFDDAVTERLLVPVAKQEYGISLRLLDYCMTNWAKKTRVMVELPTGHGPTPLNIFSLYKDWLRFYRRRGFDPFRRRERIFFTWTPDGEPEETLDTTVAQLNFLSWAEKHGILEYVYRHKDQIEEDMMLTLGDSKRRRQDQQRAPKAAAAAAAAAAGGAGRKRKRTELSRAPEAKCVVYPIGQEVRFDAAGGALL